MTTITRNWDDLTEAEKRQARAISIHGGPGLAGQGIHRTVPKGGWLSPIATSDSIKQGVCDEICSLIGAPQVPLSTGSTELKRLMVMIDGRLGLGLDLNESKPVLCEQIAIIGSETWDDRCDSRDTPSGGGSTITLFGLLTLRDACATIVDRLTAP